MLYLPWLNGVVIMETIKIKAISEGIAYGRALLRKVFAQIPYWSVNYLGNLLMRL